MKTLLLTPLILAQLLLLSPVNAELENLAKQLKGEWAAGGVRNILGKGHEDRIHFSNINGKLQIAFKTLYFSSVNGGGNAQKPTVLGPYRIKKLTTTELTYVRNDQEYHVTFRLHKNRVLEWGAIISADNKKWRYAFEIPVHSGGKITTRSGTAQWSFSSDPFKEPMGSAQLPGHKMGNAYYIYETVPGYKTGSKTQPVIRVMTKHKDGSLSEQFRLIWDTHGSPRCKGVFNTGQNLKHIGPVIYHPASR
ncbi:MAG: hypothetical protein ACPG32_08935 [Akkermansiaceae bacterium]